MATKRKPKEIERRWYVRSIDRRFFPKSFKKVWDILQGFLEIRNSTQSVRIRLVTNGIRHATMAAKQGKGRVRVEVPSKVDWNFGVALMRDCRLRISKVRSFTADGWQLDRFRGPLRGIILLERELKRKNAKVVLPSWVKDAVEVTDFFTNRDLARLSLKLRRTGGNPRAAVEALIAKHHAGQ